MHSPFTHSKTGLKDVIYFQCQSSVGERDQRGKGRNRANSVVGATLPLLHLPRGPGAALPALGERGGAVPGRGRGPDNRSQAEHHGRGRRQGVLSGQEAAE